MQSPGFLGYNGRVGCICHQHRHNVQRHVADLLVWYDMLNYQPKKRKQVKVIRNMKDLTPCVKGENGCRRRRHFVFALRQRHQCRHNLKKLWENVTFKEIIPSIRGGGRPPLLFPLILLLRLLMHFFPNFMKNSLSFVAR